MSARQLPSRARPLPFLSRSYNIIFAPLVDNTAVKKILDKSGIEDMEVICFARPTSLTVRVPALGSRPSLSHLWRSVVVIVKMSWISRGITGRLSISESFLLTTAETARNPILSLSGIANVSLAGEEVEATRLRQLASTAGYAVAQLGRGECCGDPVDPFTAVVVLYHDLEAEHAMMKVALRSQAFYIGALGSSRTHRKRVEYLREHGWNNEDIARIKAPIGLFGPTKDSASLALSVLGDIAASRFMLFG